MSDKNKPLRGKVFFLDLPRYKHLEAVEKKLVQRGATVESFFHRGVKYLVTNRHKTPAGKKGDLAVNTSRALNANGGGGSRLGIPSPSSTGSKTKSIPVAYGTRAAKMLAASVRCMHYTSTFVAYGGKGRSLNHSSWTWDSDYRIVMG